MYNNASLLDLLKFQGAYLRSHENDLVTKDKDAKLFYKGKWGL